MELVKFKSESELAKLAGEIGWYEEQSRKTVALALQYKLEIGRRLARAKLMLPHGQFLSWAQQEFGWTPRHVQRHLELVKHATSVACLPAGTSLRMALVAVRALRVQEEKIGTECCQPQGVRIVGDLEPPTIDRDRLLAAFARVAEELGAQKMRWRIR